MKSDDLKPWMRGPFELIRHADRHLKANGDTDRRIALIGFDNAIEIYRKDQAFCEKHSVEFVQGWYVATNLNDDSMDHVIQMACRVAGLTPNVDVSYSLD